MKQTIVGGRILFNGQEYGGADEMPPEARRMYEAIVADEDGNGIPDLMEMKGRDAIRAVWKVARAGTSSAPAAHAMTFRVETTGWRLLLVAAAALIAYLAFRG